MSDLSGVVNEQRGTIETLQRRVAELEDRQKTLVEAYIYDHKQWAGKEAGGTAVVVVLACLLLDKTQEFIQAHGHNPKGNVEDAFAAITAENAELKRQVDALREERKVSEALYDQLHTMSKTHAFRLCDDGSINAMDLETDDWDILESGPAFDALKVYLEALREAAKGGVVG